MLNSNRLTLRSFNNFLTFIVLVLSVYMILFPFLPHLQLWIDRVSDDTNGVRYSGLLAAENNISDEDNSLAEAPKENRLVIPGITLDEELVVGDDPGNIHRGAWHRPQTSTPDKGGNTVIVGHRFSYNSPATFYHLDKMDMGDTFAIWWEEKEYVYEVYNTTIVNPSAIEIEDNTDEPIATLYTCTPVWTATARLVVQAKLINLEVLELEEI